MASLRIGLIGCGNIARAVHLPVLRALPGVQLVALAEPADASRALAVRAAPEAALFSDYRDLIAAGGLDGVVICLPPKLHAPSAVAAFDAGVHIYLEKPLATSIGEGNAILQAWRRAGTVGMIGFNFRFHPQVEQIRAQLQRGAIGALLGVRSVFSILPHELPGWKQSRALGGGVLLDLASHHIDLVHHLLNDPVVRAYATQRSLQGEGDHAALQLELASGAVLQTFVSLGTVDENRMEFFGTAGKLIMDRTELLRPAHVPATLRGARARRLGRALSALEPGMLLRSPGAEPSFRLALEAFVAAAAGGHFSGPDLSDGARNLAVIEAAERSAASGEATAPDWPTAMPATPGMRTAPR